MVPLSRQCCRVPSITKKIYGIFYFTVCYWRAYRVFAIFFQAQEKGLSSTLDIIKFSKKNMCIFN